MANLSRLEALVGAEGIKKLKKASVMVFGLGGVGSYAVEALARSGVGRLILVDSDKIDETNINRQLYALSSTIGMKKTMVAKRRIEDIDLDIKVDIFDEMLGKDNLDEFLQMSPDWIADAIDDVSAKVMLLASCRETGQKIISSMGFANKIHPEMIEIAYLSDTSVCPLARTMRQKLRALGVATDIPVVYSKEEAIPSPILGSVSFVPASAGLCLAGYIVRQITEKE